MRRPYLLIYAGRPTTGTAVLTESEQRPEPSLGKGVAQITPGGLRLYDAEGTCSIVPLEELRRVMQRLSFSR